MSEIDYSVVIPIYNGDRYINDLIDAYRRQTILPKEMIFIDSSDKGNSEKIIREVTDKASFRLVYNKIPKDQFSHSLTRNYAASLSTGSVILFTVQDALPKDNQMMETILNGFLDDTVACVFARHEAYNRSVIVTKLEIERCFDGFNISPGGYTVQSIKSEPSRYLERPEWYWFNSDVCSAVKQSVFNIIKFRNVPYAEDQLFGKDIIEAGYSKVFANNAVILHSHDYTLTEHFKRAFDENRGMLIAVGKCDNVSMITIVPKILRNTYRDLNEARKSMRGVSFSLWPYVFSHHLMKFTGYFFGKHYRKLPKALQVSFSLERKAY